MDHVSTVDIHGPSVQLTTHPEVVCNWLTGGSDEVVFAAMRHSFRATVADEFDACALQGLESPLVLDEQRSLLAKRSPRLLATQPIWAGLIARRHGDSELLDAMERWWANLLRYSRRDQLSLPNALQTIDASKFRLVAGSNYESPVHK